MHHTRQGPIAAVLAMALLWPLAFSAPAGGNLAARTLDRDADPVIVSGASMPGLAGAPLAQLFVYALRGGQWQQIPWQFDENKDGQYVALDNSKLDEPQPKILDGRVRAIAGYQESGQSILTIAYRSQFFDVVSVDFSWSPLPFEWARATADFNPNMIGGTYYDANTPAGVPVDGIPDAVALTPASLWQQISGATGTVLHADDVSPMQGTVSTYYKDSATVDPTDTGDRKSYGEMGVTITNPIKYLYLKVTHYILLPNQPNVGDRYYSVANDGSGTLAWTATEAASWLEISPKSGNASTGSPATITVNVLPGAIGRFETDVTIAAAPGVLHSPRQVHIVLANMANLKRIFLPMAMRP
jgi:hypothetical protein